MGYCCESGNYCQVEAFRADRVVSKNTNKLKPGAPGRFGLALRPELSVDEPRRVRKCERIRNLEWAGLAELLGDHESVR